MSTRERFLVHDPWDSQNNAYLGIKAPTLHVLTKSLNSPWGIPNMWGMFVGEWKVRVVFWVWKRLKKFQIIRGVHMWLTSWLSPASSPRSHLFHQLLCVNVFSHRCFYWFVWKACTRKGYCFTQTHFWAGDLAFIYSCTLCLWGIQVTFFIWI